MYVGLQQVGPDVRIYAAGVFRVSRRVVPDVVVFDASGIAGDQASPEDMKTGGRNAEESARKCDRRTEGAQARRARG